jgi:hypothetical protein
MHEVDEKWIVQNAINKIRIVERFRDIEERSGLHKDLHKLIEEVALESFIYGKEANSQEVDRLQAQLRRLE